MAVWIGSGMGWSRKRKPDLADDLGILLGDLCVEWGFCNRLMPEDLIAAGKILTADEFARAVLVAEGMDPNYSKWLHPIRDKFIERYGSSVSMDSYAPH
jgi:hypothetical protein